MKDNHFRNFIIIGIALLLVSIAYPFIVNYFFNDWQKSGTFGDTFGALNALFSGLAFVGLIITILIQKTELINQRKELGLQRSEMKETRREFLINRITNLIYKQLERFEKNLNELIIEFNEFKHKGDDAISILDSIKEHVSKDPEKPEEELLELEKESNIRQSKIHGANRSAIEKFSHNAYNSVEVLKSLLYKSNLEIEELNDLKNLFFENIGFITMGVIENIFNISRRQIEILEDSDYEKYDIEVGIMHRSTIFLKPIIEFYNTRFTKENFEGLKENWIKSKGDKYKN